MPNVHPLFVHFPIAFLALYTVLEIARFPQLTRQGWWFPTKALLVIVGTVSGGIAIITGLWAAEAFPEGGAAHAIIEQHELFGYVAIALYGLCALDYVLAIKRGRQLLPSPLLVLLSALGFGALMIVGALGASIVYGPEIDPVVEFIHGVLVGG